MRRLSRSIAGVVGADSLVCDCAFGGYLSCHCNCLTAQQDLFFSFRRQFGLFPALRPFRDGMERWMSPF